MPQEVESYVYDSDDVVDITDDVECYEKGKTFECECGQGIGINHKRRDIKCANCKKICVDTNHKQREPKEKDEGQQTFDSMDIDENESSEKEEGSSGKNTGSKGQSTLGDW